MGIIDAFYSLNKPVNKSKGNDEYLETREGVVSEMLPELVLKMSDEDLIDLTTKWKNNWDNSPVKAEWIVKCNDNENYWLGKQFGKVEMEQLRPLIDNIIFEAVETFLPQATKNNPEAVVQLAHKSDQNNPQLQEIVTAIEEDLNDLADELKLKLKVKKAARHWLIYLLGVCKLGWSMERQAPTIKIIRPKKLILDPDGVVDEDGYTGKYLGEIRKMEASILIQMVELSDAKAYIKAKVDNKMGTDVQFIEWWTNEYICWTLDKKVLLKRKNPNWNYEKEVQDTNVDDYGVETPTTQTLPGQNHLTSPSMPYRFLSIFNLGKQPVDDTSLITQNLPGQDLVNSLLKQEVKNVKSMNGGIVVSEGRSGLTQEQAASVTEALRNGGTVTIPDGAPKEAIDRFDIGGLPVDVYNLHNNTIERLRDRFGVRGSSAAGIQSEQTVRGKVISKSLDTDRIGGGITEYLEQFTDDIFNYIVQLKFVYEEKYQGLQIPKLLISVKGGSLLPKDKVSEANQAVDLAMGGKLSLIDLFTKLEYPNPEETAANVWLEVNAPQILYAKDPRVQQVIQMQQQAAAQQQQMQSEQQAQEAGGKDQQMKDQAQQKDLHKAFDHESKMAQIQAKNEGNLLKRVPTQ